MSATIQTYTVRLGSRYLKLCEDCMEAAMWLNGPRKPWREEPGESTMHWCEWCNRFYREPASQEDGR